MANPGDTYRPGSGIEGMAFEECYCNQCKKQPVNPDDGGCDILCNASCFGIKDPEYPKDKWIYGDDGQPTCTEFEENNIED